MQGIIERKGLIGENVKYLMHKYSIPEQAFINNLHEMFLRINQCNKPSMEIKQVTSQVVELLTCDVENFNQNEIECIIDVLCTH